MPGFASPADTVGPVIDIVGILDATFTVAPLTGLPAGSFTAIVTTSGPCRGGEGLRAAESCRAPCEGPFIESAADAIRGEAKTAIANAMDVDLIMNFPSNETN